MTTIRWGNVILGIVVALFTAGFYYSLAEPWGLGVVLMAIGVLIVLVRIAWLEAKIRRGSKKGK
jgi:hypothetical protein